MAKEWHKWAFVGLMILCFLAKYPLLGTLNFGQHHESSAAVLNYASNWYEEGFFHLKGFLYDQPGSVEFSDPASRSYYNTGMPVFVLPIFILSKITAHLPEIGMINLWNFILHVFSAYLLGLLAYGFSSHLKEKYRKGAFFGACFTCLFSYQFLYFYSAVYWMDQMVIPIIAGILLCEQKLDGKMKQKNNFFLWQQLLVLLAVVTDWYGFVFVLFLLGYHFYKKTPGRVVQLLYPVGLGIGIVFSYLSVVSGGSAIRQYILAGLGFASSLNELGRGKMLAEIFVTHLGVYSLLFLGAFAMADRMQRKKEVVFKYITLMYNAPLLYSLLFAVGTYPQEFSVLKFYIPILVFLFGVAPATLWSFADSRKETRKKNSQEIFGLRVLAVLPVIFTLGALAFHYNGLLEKNSNRLEEMARLQWMKSISEPEEVLFSNEYAVNYFPAQGPYVLRKSVWTFSGQASLMGWVRIFRDAVDYPLLWIEKKVPETEACAALYLREGAVEKPSSDEARAFLFSSVKKFSEIKDSQLEKCL